MRCSLGVSLSSSASKLAIVALPLIALAAPVRAQDAAAAQPQSAAATPAPDNSTASSEPVEDIVVTGTLIRGVAPTGAPVLTISTQDIAAAGVSNSSELLRRVPQIANIGADESKTNTTTNLANANGTLGNGLNLRGLGTQATLTLVNGFRPAPGGLFGLFFDPNSIPTIALGGVDVVADGASALYGSDAIAGVVNLKLRRDVDGVEVSGRYGFADDFHRYQLSGIAGKKWDNGRIMFAADHSYSSALYALDRPKQYQADQRAAGGTDQRTLFASPGNIVVGSTIYGVPANPTGAGLTFADLSTTPNLLSGWTDATALPVQERNSFVLAGDYDVSPSVNLYVQSYYTKRKFSKNNGRIGVAAQQSTLAVPNSNPYFISGIPGATTSQTVRLSWIDLLGPETAHGYQENYQIVGGAKIDLTDALQLDVNYNHSYNRDIRNRLNQLNLCALQGTTTPITPACTVAGGALGQTDPALAFNPYGPNSQAVLGKIRAQLQQDNFYKEDTFAAKLDGKLFYIGGGAVRFALGAQTMRESAGYKVVQNNDTADNSIFRTQVEGVNTRRVNSVFGEVVFPFIGSDNALPGVESLSVSVAGRYDHYSDQGSTTNPKVGVTWGVGSGLTLRGSYGKSFRASLIQTDPAANGGIATRPLADYTRNGTTNYIVVTGGNRDLKPERSRTINLGAEYRPEFARGLSLSATYFDVKYTDIIDNPGNTIGTTGITSAAREAIFAAFIQRRPTDATGSAAFTQQAQDLLNSDLLLVGGNVPPAASINVILDGRTFNSGRLRAQGIDFTALYQFDTSIGAWEAGLVGTYYTKYQRSFSALEPLTDRRSLIEFPTKYNLRGSLRWDYEGFRAAAYVNHLPSYTNTFTPSPSKVKAYTTVDMTLGYAFEEGAGALEGLSISLEASNLFDQDPPIARVANQLFDSNSASALGRQISLRVTKAF